ncbi:MAG: DUF2293 domain-containing protein, partial [Candidatus Omnitrophota bacterium]
QYVANFAKQIRMLFPKSPAKCEEKIAEHACLKYSGRIGRTQQAKKLDEKAIRLAVIAYIRHECTSYDTFLAKGYDRGDARSKVEDNVQKLLIKWSKKEER